MATKGKKTIEQPVEITQAPAVEAIIAAVPPPVAPKAFSFVGLLGQEASLEDMNVALDMFFQSKEAEVDPKALAVATIKEKRDEARDLKEKARQIMSDPDVQVVSRNLTAIAKQEKKLRERLEKAPDFVRSGSAYARLLIAKNTPMGKNIDLDTWVRQAVEAIKLPFTAQERQELQDAKDALAMLDPEVVKRRREADEAGKKADQLFIEANNIAKQYDLPTTAPKHFA